MRRRLLLLSTALSGCCLLPILFTNFPSTCAAGEIFSPSRNHVSEASAIGTSEMPVRSVSHIFVVAQGESLWRLLALGRPVGDYFHELSPKLAEHEETYLDSPDRVFQHTANISARRAETGSEAITLNEYVPLPEGEARLLEVTHVFAPDATASNCPEEEGPCRDFFGVLSPRQVSSLVPVLELSVAELRCVMSSRQRPGCNFVVTMERIQTAPLQASGSAKFRLFTTGMSPDLRQDFLRTLRAACGVQVTPGDPHTRYTWWLK